MLQSLLFIVVSLLGFEHMLYEQYSRLKVKSKNIKEILSHSIKVRHVWELVLYMEHTISQSMSMKKVEFTFLSPAQIPRQIWKGIIQQHYDVSANNTTRG